MRIYNFCLIKKITVVLFCLVSILATVQSSSFAADILNTTNTNDNYIIDVYDKYKQIVTWKKNYILVYIPRDAREEFVWSQFKIWENVLGGQIVFEKILTQQNADILVHYENPYLGKKVGFTRLSFKDGDIRRADMFIYDDILTNPLKNFAVLHEIGHALGITNNSPNPADIMFATKTARQNGLSQRDKNTIRMMYNPDRSAMSISIAGNNTDTRSIELQKADMLIDNMQAESAMELYKKILASGKEQAEAYSGIARCHYTLGNGNSAYKYAKKAYSLQSDNKLFLYGLIKIALDTNHAKELKKCIDSYLIKHPEDVTDNTIQSALTLTQMSSEKKKK